ncbi:MAG: hypothetical protein M0024_00915 [Nitrospiraceae bacterium]|nr:hypothetical protein [Nitrospiraceae bacterium]
MRYHYEKIDHREGGNAGELIPRVRAAFLAQGENLRPVRQLAEEVAELVKGIDRFQQDACAAVCPSCTSVCCVNRHSYHEHEDIIYIYAKGEQEPAYDLNVRDNEPCQFLGQYGCTIGRHLRPHRCNSYFCIPMLAYLEDLPAAEYRRFMRELGLVTRKREELLEEFYNRTRSL